ncbi:hypothetical protein SLA2020_467850 [Shorea laevis]
MTHAAPPSSDQLSHTPSNPKLVLSGPRDSELSVVGLLSKRVETQLCLGNKPTSGKKRSNDSGPCDEIFKRACIRFDADVEMPCSPNQMQKALALGRSAFHKQDQEGFFTNVEELISV